MLTRLALIGVSVLYLFLLGCDSASTPEDTTLEFWNAVKVNDQALIDSLSTPITSSGNLTINGSDITRIKVTDVLTSQSQASVMTYLYVLEEGKEQLYRFNTLLVKDSDDWKVDREDTTTQLLTVRLQDIKDEVTRALKQGIGEAGRALQKKLEQINSTTSQTGNNSGNIDQELEKLGTELENSLGSLGSAMANTIKSAAQSAAKEAIKGMEEATQALEQELEEMEQESKSNNN